MGFWNWLGIFGGLAMAIHELHPLWRSRHSRNKEWWSGLLWGFIGLTVAASSLIGGLPSVSEATAAAGRITNAENETRRIRGILESNAHGELRQQQCDEISRAGPPPFAQYSLKFLANKFDNGAQGFAQGLAQSFEIAGWFSNDDVWRDDVAHDGILIIAPVRSASLDRLEQILGDAGIDFRTQIEPGVLQRFDIGSEQGAAVSVGKLK